MIVVSIERNEDECDIIHKHILTTPSPDSLPHQRSSQTLQFPLLPLLKVLHGLVILLNRPKPIRCQDEIPETGFILNDADLWLRNDADLVCAGET